MATFELKPTPQYFIVTSPAEYVVHVEINRPEKLNSFKPPMWLEMRTIFQQLSVSRDVRVVLFSGRGDRAFTTGLDVQAAGEGEFTNKEDSDGSRRATRLRRSILDFQDCVTWISRCEKPVIALLHGYTFGLGIDLATAADIRLAADTVKFSVKEVDIGIAADVGTLARLPKIAGFTSWVKEVALTARVFGAQEAYHNNFVSQVVPGGKDGLVKAGLDLAKVIASKSPVAVQGTKNVIDAGYGRVLEDNLNYVAVWNSAMLQSSDFEQAITTYSAKMVSRVVVLALRATEFVFTLIVMALIGNIIDEANHGNPASINFTMFVSAFSMFTLIYLFAAAINEKYAVHPVLPLAVDLLNTLFFFCSGVALAAELGAHSCSNKEYTHSNHITNGADDTEGRCREAQASTAFLWFAWAAYTASVFVSFLGARSGGVNLRSGGGRKGAPSMSQV
ncbi:hypothetical protein DV738_g2406, partial [Chaetothyriales sp. CBS 135597]